MREKLKEPSCLVGVLGFEGRGRRCRREKKVSERSIRT